MTRATGAASTTASTSSLSSPPSALTRMLSTTTTTTEERRHYQSIDGRAHRTLTILSPKGGGIPGKHVPRLHGDFTRVISGDDNRTQRTPLLRLWKRNGRRRRRGEEEEEEEVEAGEQGKEYDFGKQDEEHNQNNSNSSSPPSATSSTKNVQTEDTAQPYEMKDDDGTTSVSRTNQRRVRRRVSFPFPESDYITGTGSANMFSTSETAATTSRTGPDRRFSLSKRSLSQPQQVIPLTEIPRPLASGRSPPKTGLGNVDSRCLGTTSTRVPKRNSQNPYRLSHKQDGQRDTPPHRNSMRLFATASLFHPPKENATTATAKATRQMPTTTTTTTDPLQSSHTFCGNVHPRFFFGVSEAAEVSRDNAVHRRTNSLPSYLPSTDKRSATATDESRLPQAPMRKSSSVSSIPSASSQFSSQKDPSPAASAFNSLSCNTFELLITPSDICSRSPHTPETNEDTRVSDKSRHSSPSPMTAEAAVLTAEADRKPCQEKSSSKVDQRYTDSDVDEAFLLSLPNNEDRASSPDGTISRFPFLRPKRPFFLLEDEKHVAFPTKVAVIPPHQDRGSPSIPPAIHSMQTAPSTPSTNVSAESVASTAEEHMVTPNNNTMQNRFLTTFSALLSQEELSPPSSLDATNVHSRRIFRLRPRSEHTRETTTENQNNRRQYASDQSPVQSGLLFMSNAQQWLSSSFRAYASRGNDRVSSPDASAPHATTSAVTGQDEDEKPKGPPARTAPKTPDDTTTSTSLRGQNSLVARPDSAHTIPITTPPTFLPKTSSILELEPSESPSEPKRSRTQGKDRSKPKQRTAPTHEKIRHEISSLLDNASEEDDDNDEDDGPYDDTNELVLVSPDSLPRDEGAHVFLKTSTDTGRREHQHDEHLNASRSNFMSSRQRLSMLVSPPAHMTSATMSSVPQLEHQKKRHSPRDEEEEEDDNDDEVSMASSDSSGSIGQILDRCNTPPVVTSVSSSSSSTSSSSTTVTVASEHNTKWKAAVAASFDSTPSLHQTAMMVPPRYPRSAGPGSNSRRKHPNLLMSRIRFQSLSCVLEEEDIEDGGDDDGATVGSI